MKKHIFLICLILIAGCTIEQSEYTNDVQVPIQVEQCTDSDNSYYVDRYSVWRYFPAEDVFIRGIVTKGEYGYEDYCIDDMLYKQEDIEAANPQPTGKYVVEHTCLTGTIVEKFVRSCSKGCTRGACILIEGRMVYIGVGNELKRVRNKTISLYFEDGPLINTFRNEENTYIDLLNSTYTVYVSAPGFYPTKKTLRVPNDLSPGASFGIHLILSEPITVPVVHCRTQDNISYSFDRRPNDDVGEEVSQQCVIFIDEYVYGTGSIGSCEGKDCYLFEYSCGEGTITGQLVECPKDCFHGKCVDSYIEADNAQWLNK